MKKYERLRVPNRIKSAVTSYYGVSEDQIKTSESGNKPKYAKARALLSYMLKTRTKMRNPDISAFCGYNSSQASILGRQRIKAGLSTPEVSKALSYVICRLKADDSDLANYKKKMCSALGVTVDELDNCRSRSGVMSTNRQCITHFLHKQFGHNRSMVEIGEVCGYSPGAAHSAVIHNNRVLSNLIEINDPRMTPIYEAASAAHDRYNAEMVLGNDVWIGLPTFPVNFRSQLVGGVRVGEARGMSEYRPEICRV